MMTEDMLTFASLGTVATNLDLKIRLKQMDIRDEKVPENLYQLSIDLINLVEEKTRCIYNIMELTGKLFLPTV